MANKGESKTQKRISSPKVRKFLRKVNTFTIKSRPGPHSAKTSVPLGFVIRDMLKIVNNMKEAKHILHNTEVLVNGTRRQDHRFPIGIFDIVEIKQAKKKFRAVLNRKGAMVMNEMAQGEKNEKICKLVGKGTAKKGLTQLRFNDGTVLLSKDAKMHVGDSVKLELPSKKMLGIYALDKGSTAYVIGGVHVGKVARINEIVKGTITRSKLVNLASESEEFQTIEENVFVIGKDEAEIEIGQE